MSWPRARVKRGSGVTDRRITHPVAPGPEPGPSTLRACASIALAAAYWIPAQGRDDVGEFVTAKPPLPPAAIPSCPQLRYKEPMTDPALHSARSPDPAPLARLGQFAVRLAATEAERHAAFRLRYEVFHRERGVNAPSMDHAEHIEADAFDPFCDHI